MKVGHYELVKRRKETYLEQDLKNIFQLFISILLSVIALETYVGDVLKIVVTNGLMISEQTGLNQKTVQTILFDLKDEKEDVKMKKIGRYRLF